MGVGRGVDIYTCIIYYKYTMAEFIERIQRFGNYLLVTLRLELQNMFLLFNGSAPLVSKLIMID